jgi:hypothetical protein
MLARSAHSSLAVRALLESDETLRAVATGPYAVKSVEDAVVHVLKVVDNATREGQGGRFMNWDETVNPW